MPAGVTTVQFRPRLAALLLGLCGLGLGGCSALTNPVGDAVPVRRLPPEVLGRRKDEERTIPLSWLRQKAPDVYRLAPGDTLGVWVDLEGPLGDKSLPPPVRLGDSENATPAIGYPVPVRDDGSISLPQIDPLRVEGLTVKEAEAEIIKAYTVTKKIIRPGRERVIVTLMKPRTYQVLVVRQDSGALTVGQTGAIGQTKRGTGYSLDLPAYKNDVLNALARTGGLPGLDAQNEVVIQRGALSDFTDPAAMRCAVEGGAPGASGATPAVRIPLRMRPGEPPPFRPEDVVLRTGDIVFIEARDTEVFYTGGLLPPHQFPVPRDYDLDVIQAISFVNGPLVNGGINVSNLNGNLLQPGIGFPSPSLVTILRRTPGGGQIPIRVDLNVALRDPRERVLVQPGDMILLQETVAEATGRYLTEVFRFSFLGTTIRQRDLLGTATLSLP
jgi:protein involved in polysaccharide export with SLBB domain